MQFFFGCALTAFGTWLTVHGGEEDSQRIIAELRDQKEANINILQKLKEQKDINARAQQEFREKIQAVLVQVNAANHEDSKKITEEKIRVIEKDFTDWAVEFTKNQSKIKSEFNKTKGDFEQAKTQAQIDEVKKEIQISEKSFPLLSFTVRYIQEMIAACAKQTGKQIKIDPADLSGNFYEKPADFAIHFPGQAIWTFKVLANKPLKVNRGPVLQIIFMDSHAQESGTILLRISPSQNKYWIKYQTPIPTPNSTGLEGEKDLSDYESTIREVFQPIIETQLIQTVE